MPPREPQCTSALPHDVRMPAVIWKDQPDEHDYPAAASYLALIADPVQVGELVASLHSYHPDIPCPVVPAGSV
jgi:hypothetical protein